MPQFTVLIQHYYTSDEMLTVEASHELAAIDVAKAEARPIDHDEIRWTDCAPRTVRDEHDDVVFED